MQAADKAVKMPITKKVWCDDSMSKVKVMISPLMGGLHTRIRQLSNDETVVLMRMGNDEFVDC